MRIVLQKVSAAEVTVDSKSVGRIGAGYLLFVGVGASDTEAEVRQLVEKIVHLRLWPGEGGKINDLDVLQTKGEVLVVSQFTLLGSTERGNRPDYTAAAPRELAEELYNKCIQFFLEAGINNVQSGIFGASMSVSLTNEGPVTLLLERSGPSI